MDTAQASQSVGVITCWLYIAGAFFIAFLAGAIAGFVTFASDFTDKPRILFRSGWCWAYALFSGAMAVLVFSILRRLDIQILSLSFNDAQLLLAAIIGAGWFKFLSSSWFNNESGNLSSQSLTGLFFKTKKYLYYHYSMNQMKELQPKVWDIVKRIDDSSFYYFSVRCIHLAKGISSEKGAILGDIYSQYKEKSSEIQDYKSAISIDIAKIIGIDLMQQVADEVKSLPSVSQDIEQLDAMLKVLDSHYPTGDRK